MEGFGMNAPDQDPLDVQLARVVYGRVARRWCALMMDSGQWEVVAPRDCGDGVRVWQPRAGRHFLLWCYRPSDRWSWAPVPAFGQDGGAMLGALEAYVEANNRRAFWRRIPATTYHRTLHYVTIGDEPMSWPDDDAVEAEGSTFALAARAAVLAMEDGR